MFSFSINSANSLSFISNTIAGTVSNPILFAALYLLSPSTISYLSSRCLNTNGCIIPYLFIEFDSSFNDLSSNIILG